MLHNLSINQILAITSGKLIAGDESISCSSVSTDTRTLQAGALYVPLTGENFDGHNFVAAAEQAGAVATLVEKPIETGLASIQVPDTLLALGQIAAWQRDQFNGPVVAVTGSAGKTSVKELMANVLSQQFNCLMTQGNLNNHIGAPLTLLSIEPSHQAAMIELGASAMGEIAYTAQFVRPHVGIITNIGEAHLEGFGSRENIAQGKGELIDHILPNGTAVLNQDDDFIDLLKARAAKLNLLTFGFSSEADVFATDIATHSQGSSFTLHAEGQSFVVQLSLAGKHNVRNALAVVAAARALEMAWSDILAGLQSARSIKGRLQLAEGSNKQTLYDDSYNANPSSFKAAIDVLSQVENSWLIMGDMGELGPDASSMHAEIGRYAREQGIEYLVATGELSKYAVEAFGQDAKWFENIEELIGYLDQSTGIQDTLLMKGSRSAGMDRVVTALTKFKKEVN